MNKCCERQFKLLTSKYPKISYFECKVCKTIHKVEIEDIWELEKVKENEG